MTDRLTPTGPRSRDREWDVLDGRLIHALQEDGRTSVQDLARLLGASREVVSQRLRSLIAHEGLRIVAALDPGFAGHHVLVHAMVDVAGPTRPVADRIAGQSDAVFVSLVSGAAPIVFESRHGDVGALHATLDAVRAIPAVRRIRITTYVNILKGFFVAEERTDVALDELDDVIIAALQQDGRTSYSALADDVHLSPSAVRSRVRRLIDAGVIRISAIPTGVLSHNRVAIGVGITARGEGEPILRFIRSSRGVTFAARAHGVYDYIVTVGGSSSSEALGVIEELRAIDEVGAVETWTHLDIVKEDYTRPLAGVSAWLRA